MPTVREILNETAAALARARVEDARFEARQLLCLLLGADLSGLLMRYEEPFDEGGKGALDALVHRRAQGEPLQYLIGEWEFMGLEFFVSPAALIPRQDTETLVEGALRLARENGCKSALDLCCGTGCIGVGAAVLGGLDVAFSDISPECVALAKKNAGRHGVRAEFFTGDLFEPVNARFDLILCNPPYIPEGELPALSREVLHEPRLALSGGMDGLDVYRRIASGYEEYLNPRGLLLLEVGKGQAGAVRELFSHASAALLDHNGVERVVCVQT
ncbi:MAG: peptide chain release factor N(5)-glutamine methyltransferase [Bacillota bacterium]